MKIGIKIFILCMLVYIMVISLTGIIIIEKGYNLTLAREIEQSLKEEMSMEITLNTLLATRDQETGKSNKETMRPDANVDFDYNVLNKLISLYGAKGSYIEIYNTNRDIIAANHSVNWGFTRDELGPILNKGRNYILRKVGSKRYLFVSNKISNNILVAVKDISAIDLLRNEQYQFLMQIEIIGLILLGMIALVLSSYITRPISELTKSVAKIGTGNYHERVVIRSKDEVGILAAHFNTMATEIEARIGELKTESERKQRFINNLIHELRTPLTSIIGYADLLQSIKYDQQIFTKGLSNIHHEGKRLLDSAEKLMDLILANHNSLSLHAENIAEILNEVANSIRLKSAESDIKLRIEALDLWICLDRNLIKIVLFNLIENALRASNKGDTISLGVLKSDKQVTIYVKDEGKGIIADELEKITEPFYRIDKSRSRLHGGAGLGLALCKEIVEAHGAMLKIESQPHEGTIVQIIFTTI